MILDLGKAVAFLLCILTLYNAALQALLLPGSIWKQRLIVSLLYLLLAGSVCVFSGLLFSWPVSTNPDRGKPLHATLPVRLFLWGSVLIAALFLSSWWLGDLSRQAAPFISDRGTDRF